MPDFLTDSVVIVAFIAGAFGLLGVLAKGWIDAQGKRIDVSESRLNAHDDFITDVVQWALELEEHIYLGKPPPPPDRPRSLIRFFVTTNGHSAAGQRSGRGKAPTQSKEDA